MATAAKSAVAKRVTVRNVSLQGVSLGALVAELIGTCILTLAVLSTQGNAIIAGLTMLVLTLVLGSLSGGHINPLITVGLWATGKIKAVKGLMYIVAQLLGAMLALVIISKFMAGTVSQFGGPLEPYALFEAGREPGFFKPIFGELVGGLIFAFGAASAFLAKKTGYDASFTIGGSLLIGLIVATAGSSAVLNPAVALAVSAFAKGGLWSFAAYAVAPLVAGAVGFTMYRLLQSDVDKISAKTND